MNGKFVSEDDLTVSLRDIGFSRGYAVFDFLKTYPHHRPLRLKERIDRLFNSAELIDLQIPWSKEQIQKWVLETLGMNQSKEEKFIKICISGGISNTMLPPRNKTIAILIDPATQYPEEHYEKGVGVMTVKYERYNPAAKSNNYIEGVKQTQRAQIMGAVEPVYYSDTQVFEGSNSNIFAVINDEILTPKTNILEGITRSILLEILNVDIPIKIKDFTLEELLQASEAFLTASGKEITPITFVDGKPLGDGVVGTITKNAMNQFKEYTVSNTW